MVPTAAAQTTQEPDQLLHSASSGLIIHRTAQLKNEFRSGGREFAREVAEHVNRTQTGRATLFVYEEAFGVHDRIHWLIHLGGLTDYLTLITMSVNDEGFRNIFFRERIAPEKGGGDWSRMFPDGSLSERVLIPLRRPGANGTDGAAFPLPAGRQTTLPAEQILHSANAGMLVERVGIARYEARDQARELALEVAERVNLGLPGVASMFVYEEMFGRQDCLHWLIHLRALDAYTAFLAFVQEDAGLAEILRRSGPGGGWSWFLDGSLEETVLVPQFAGSSGTVKR
ncbi:MAG TPA: DUF6039 family protein [Thermoanaerobaculia bacterium]|nr:DUF6039 family protein [Thermoanaerobaculia bacterium]